MSLELVQQKFHDEFMSVLDTVHWENLDAEKQYAIEFIKEDLEWEAKHYMDEDGDCDFRSYKPHSDIYRYNVDCEVDYVEVQEVGADLTWNWNNKGALLLELKRLMSKEKKLSP